MSGDIVLAREQKPLFGKGNTAHIQSYYAEEAFLVDETDAYFREWRIDTKWADRMDLTLTQLTEGDDAEQLSTALFVNDVHGHNVAFLESAFTHGMTGGQTIVRNLHRVDLRRLDSPILVPFYSFSGYPEYNDILHAYAFTIRLWKES